MASDVPAARQVLGILRYLARLPRPVPASAIARDLGPGRAQPAPRGHARPAAAVLEHGGHPVASVALTFPDTEVDAGLMPRFASLVTRAAGEISRRIAA